MLDVANTRVIRLRDGQVAGERAGTTSAFQASRTAQTSKPFGPPPKRHPPEAALGALAATVDVLVEGAGGRDDERRSASNGAASLGSRVTPRVDADLTP
jgi:hypothetical protein